MNLIGIPEGEWNSLHRALYVLMSGISEEHFKAHWISGNEYAIWDAIKTGDTSYVDLGRIGLIKIISKLAGGWIVWYDEENVPELDIELWGPRFVTLEEWNQILTER